MIFHIKTSNLLFTRDTKYMNRVAKTSLVLSSNFVGGLLVEIVFDLALGIATRNW